MSQTLIRVAAFVLDKSKLTLYTDKGETVEIASGDPRLRPLLKEIEPIVKAGGIAEVSLAHAMYKNDFQQMEEKSNGAFRFLKIMKSKLLSIFGVNGEELDTDRAGQTPRTAGVIPTGISSKLDEILDHALPLNSTQVVEPSINLPAMQKPENNTTIGGAGPDETIIAVTAGGKVVAGMESLAPQIHHAVKHGHQKGMEKLIERCALVADDRGHSVEDLLRFINRSDLAVADDGCLLAYKVLNNSNKKGYFVDVHSGKVYQKVGSRVCMDPKLVDHNRRNECSNGLHIARRAYVGNFHGSVCCLVKVAPEDVIAVPNYDANKMRVCAYHIIDQLSPQAFSLVKDNQPFTGLPQAQEMLAKAIAGQHVGVTEISEVRGHMGSDLDLREVGDGVVVKTTAGIELFNASSLRLDHATALEEVNGDVSQDKKLATDEVMSVAVTAADAPKQESVAQVIDPNLFKAAEQGNTSTDALLDQAVSEEKEVPVDAVTPVKAPAKKKAVKAKPQPKPKAVKPKKETKVQATTTKPATFSTLKEEGQYLEARFLSFARGTKDSNAAAKDIADFKKRTKKGWAVIGISDAVATSVKIITK